MKRKLLATLALPFALATGCADDDATATFVDAFLEFSGAVSVGTEIEGETTEWYLTRQYLVYEGEVNEINDFPTFVTITEENCSAVAENQIATSTKTEKLKKGKFKQRYIGSQKAWIVRENAGGDNSWDSAPIGTVDSFYGANIYLSDPVFAAYDYELFEGSDSYEELDYAGTENGFITDLTDVEDYNQYWYDKLVEEIVGVFVEESTEYDAWITDTTTTWYNNVVTVVTDVLQAYDTDSNFEDNSFDFTEMDHYVYSIVDDFIWYISADSWPEQGDDYSSAYPSKHVPATVKVGDAWVRDNYFWTAVTTEAIEMSNGITVQTLVLVQRGYAYYDVQNADVFNTCVDFFYSSQTTTENEPANTVTDEVDLSAIEAGPCDYDYDSEFVNENTYWYFGGLFIRQESWDRIVELVDFGYVRHDLTDGSCDVYSFEGGDLPISSVSVTETEQYRPFVQFQIHEESMERATTQFRQINRALADYTADYGNAGDASGDGTAATEATEETE